MKPLPEIRKQVSIFVPLSDWRMIRLEAARLRIPMTELCRRWLERDMGRLRRRSGVRPARFGESQPAADRRATQRAVDSGFDCEP